MFERRNMFKLMSLYNAFTAAAVLYQYSNDPEANTQEYMFDVCTHLISAVQFSGILDKCLSHVVQNDTSTVLNTARLFTIGYRLSAGNSTIPTIANVIDIGNHLENLFKISQLKDEQESIKSSRPKLR
jgi:hypothetical protein